MMAAIECTHWINVVDDHIRRLAELKISPGPRASAARNDASGSIADPPVPV